MLDSLGFVIHPDKSNFVPKQVIVFLGFEINSVNMSVKLTPSKIENLKALLSDTITRAHHIRIKSIAKVIGHMISSLPGVQFGPLHYRYLEMEKIYALKLSKGNFDDFMSVSSEGLSDLNWWLRNLDISYNVITHPPVDIVISSDASLKGWGAVCKEETTGGRWTPSEAEYHINVLELMAAYFAIKCFYNSLKNKHVKIMVDNTTAVAVINKMGTCHSRICNSIAIQIWDFCVLHDIWLTAAHTPGCDNVEADRASREFHNRDTEWKLNQSLLSNAIITLNFHPDIDLFASRLNKQYNKYVAYKPDPEAMAVDAFTLSWAKMNFYCFPPFSCIPKVLQKIQTEKARGILVAPMWPTQPWYPILMSLLVKEPVVLKPAMNLLSLPESPETKHPLHMKMSLIICLLSGDN